MRRKRRSKKDTPLGLASAELEKAFGNCPNELLEELVAAILKLCRSKLIRGCSICTDVVEETAHVSARLLSEANGCFLDECIQHRLAMLDEIVQSIIKDSDRHKSARWSLGFRPFKHDEVAIRKTKEQLRQADSAATVSFPPRISLQLLLHQRLHLHLDGRSVSKLSAKVLRPVYRTSRQLVLCRQYQRLWCCCKGFRYAVREHCGARRTERPRRRNSGARPFSVPTSADSQLPASF
ncbi:hypothetical protein BDZ89DRAFT_343950 [Hymenopellis radicata]|nr:hypothetical protein BDZ89DRAFT_343950 [Hymenopellis radicata]